LKGVPLPLELEGVDSTYAEEVSHQSSSECISSSISSTLSLLLEIRGFVASENELQQALICITRHLLVQQLDASWKLESVYIAVLE
jgi:hypothetical protein